MKKIFGYIKTIGSCFPVFNLIFYRMKYKGLYIHPSVKIIDNSGKLNYRKNNAIADRSTLILTQNADIYLGDNVWLGQDVHIEPLKDRSVILDDGCSIQDRCRLIGDIYIGKNVLLAPNVFISSGNHFFDLVPALPIRIQDTIAVNNGNIELQNKKVIIEDDCWIGTNAVIMKGLKIGKGAVVGANAVVTKDVEPYTVVGGIPAKPLKKRLCFEPPEIIQKDNIEHLPYFYSGFVLEGFDVTSNKIQNVKLRIEKEFTVSLQSVNNYDFNSVYIVIKALNVPVGTLSICFNNKQTPVSDGIVKYSFPVKCSSQNMYSFDLVPITNNKVIEDGAILYAIEAGLE